jgi:hypothetical protein
MPAGLIEEENGRSGPSRPPYREVVALRPQRLKVFINDLR